MWPIVKVLAKEELGLFYFSTSRTTRRTFIPPGGYLRNESLIILWTKSKYLRKSREESLALKSSQKVVSTITGDLIVFLVSPLITPRSVGEVPLLLWKALLDIPISSTGMLTCSPFELEF